MSRAILQVRESVEIHLMSGDFYFGDKNTRITTVLGSCVSIAVWHPLLHIGAMSHSLLPCRGKNKPGSHHLDGLYIDDSIELHLREISKRNTRPDEYQVKLFGGGNMFKHPREEKYFDIGGGNIQAARELLEAGGFMVNAEHVGGSGHRRIIFDLSDGSVLVKHESI
ncbi:MAG: chemotaxis protein CheD [Gallionellaceae bacterium]|nr:chemotaxis protein CheD [Gallionellaceae bacterium]